MSQVAVVYWSGTGNTEAMALAVVKGVEAKGETAVLFSVSDFSADLVDAYEAIAFGCPSMGCEQLEGHEFEPVFEDCLPMLREKKVALFGSYDWGDGEWMSEWGETCGRAGVKLVTKSVICNEYPDDEALLACEQLGQSLV